MKVGIFGGSFDPPHIAHSIVAERVRSELHLDQILWIPAYDPPHKSSLQLSPFSYRLGMVRAAISDHSAFEVSDIESTLDGPTYTIEMLQAIRKQCRHAQLYLILGSDSLIQFHTWSEPEAIMELVQIVVYPRAGYEIERITFSDDLSKQTHYIDAPVMSLSGQYIRDCIEEKKSVRYLVLKNVMDYILKHGVYTS